MQENPLARVPVSTWALGRVPAPASTYDPPGACYKCKSRGLISDFFCKKNMKLGTHNIPFNKGPHNKGNSSRHWGDSPVCWSLTHWGAELNRLSLGWSFQKALAIYLPLLHSPHKRRTSSSISTLKDPEKINSARYGKSLRLPTAFFQQTMM